MTGAVRRCAAARLTAQQKRKYEIAAELGLLDKVRAVGWAGLTAKETGRIGGMMHKHARKGD
ncbi:MAG: small, acid-soluble spore protein, alpha/beta type [Clostridia bacterium]|nr:small, acid-soluble spore protein, alpha/beta type [Clostridia bacterium]